MTPVLIGFASGITTIVMIGLLKLRDIKLMYGLVLSGIGFLYVGFVWMDTTALIINAMQAVVFVLLAYVGFKTSQHLLACGYFLHGAWDIIYNFLGMPGLVPPHYDWFCSTLDFTIGVSLLLNNVKLNPFKTVAKRS